MIKKKGILNDCGLLGAAVFFVIYSSGNPLSSLYNDLKVSDVKDHIVDYQSIARR